MKSAKWWPSGKGKASKAEDSGHRPLLFWLSGVSTRTDKPSITILALGEIGLINQGEGRDHGNDQAEDVKTTKQGRREPPGIGKQQADDNGRHQWKATPCSGWTKPRRKGRNGGPVVRGRPRRWETVGIGL